MIPLMAQIRIKKIRLHIAEDGTFWKRNSNVKKVKMRGISLYFPLFLLWIVLLALFVLIVPFVLLANVIGLIGSRKKNKRLSIFRGRRFFCAIWEVLVALKGFVIDVKNTDSIVKIKFF